MDYFLNTERFQKKKNEKEFVQYIHAIAAITVKDFINLANYKIYIFNRIVWEVIINGSINNVVELNYEDVDNAHKEDYGQNKINTELNCKTKEICSDLSNIKNTELFNDANDALFNIQKKIYSVKNEIFTEMEDIKRQLIKKYKLRINTDGEKLAFNNKTKNKTSKLSLMISENETTPNPKPKPKNKKTRKFNATE